MLLEDYTFDNEGIKADSLDVVYHKNTNQIELAFFEDGHYVDGVYIDISLILGKEGE